MVDVPDDIAETAFSEAMHSHDHLMSESLANIQHNNNIARSVAVKQYHQVDPLESAAAEVIGRIKPLKK
jgi:hypothetical protein